jgi:hypothetical protein
LGTSIEDNKKVKQVIDKLDGKVVLYDPPEGWRYGFPKPYRPLDGESVEDTLRRDGYPEKMMNLAKYTRFIGDV